MMNEVVYLNENNVNPKAFDDKSDTRDVWYLDYDASNHMSGNHMFFYKLDETTTGKVRFGDNSRVDILGRGSIRFLIDGGKKYLKDVYFIPPLRGNIVSLGQATEAGCEVSMKDNILMLFDKH